MVPCQRHKHYCSPIRDADLKTVIQFMQAKARRARPFTTLQQGIIGKRMNLDSTMLLTGETGNPP
jgi:hypothetical protein